jgi:hypothetical protein
MHDPEIIRNIRDAAERLGEPVGSTGDYPEGQISTADLGGLRFAITADRDTRRVLLDFGTPVTWVGLLPAQARQLAALLVRYADEADVL